ncbi:MAG: PAS domain S-box protein [Syntrophorhabdaceae bacterium]|nr:PAS domain S-box protein [Syntrophorhabdaceae bacterium]
MESLNKKKNEINEEIYSIKTQLSRYEKENTIDKEIEQKADLNNDSQENYEELLKLILALSTNFIVLPPEDFDEGIKDILKIIGLYAKADRSYVFTFSEDGKEFLNTHEWCADGIQSKKTALQKIRVETIPWFINKIKNLEIVHIPDIDVLSSEAIKEIKSFLLSDIKSLIAVPIVSSYTLIGFFGFEKVKEKRIWPESVISLLKIVGELLANAIIRKQMAKALNESEKKYRSIFDNIIEGIFQITPEGKILSVNPSFALMHGYKSPEEMLIETDETNIFADSGEFFKIKKILQEKGFIKGHELKSKKRDGSIFWTFMNARVVKDNRDEILYFEGTLINIDERKKIEETLDRERKIYSSILQNAPYGVILIDKNGKFLYVNPEFVNITGYTLEEVPTGMDWFKKAYPDKELRDDAITTWKENINIRKKAIEKVYKIRCKNNETKEIEFRATATESGETITMMIDITERRKAEELFRTLANNSPVGVYIMQKEKIKFVNNYFKEITGYEDEELIDRNPISMVYFEDIEKAIKETYRMIKGERKHPYEFRIITKSGEIKWILQNITTIQYMGKNAALASFLDISDTKQIELKLKESEERYRILAEKSPVGVYLVQDGLFRYVNQVFAEIHGFKPEEIIDKLSPRDLTFDIDEKPIEQIVKDALEDNTGFLLEITVRRKDGSIRYGELYGSKVIYNGRPAVLGTLLDVTEKKEMEEKLRSLSITDELTGVYNRRGFFTVSEQQFKMAKRLEKHLLLFYADLDELKWINDNMGHKEGDNVIVAFVNILKEAFRESDIIGRLGGDEFAILMLSTGLTNPQIIIKRLNHLVDEYNKRWKKPYKLSFSIGIAEYDPQSNNSLEELISKADDLMYIEKKKKKAMPNPHLIVCNQ